MENSKSVKMIIGERLSMARPVSRQQLCLFVSSLAASDGKEMSLNEATLKQWEHGKNRIDIEWIPYLCQALNCDVGYLFGEYPEKHRESADIPEKTGLSEDSILRLFEIAKMDNSIKSAVHCFLDSLLDDISLIDLAIAYEQFRGGELDNCYVLKKNGASVDFFDKDLPLLILQNKFTRFVLDSRCGDNRFSWKNIRKEQLESATAGDNPEVEFQTDIARGK